MPHEPAVAAVMGALVADAAALGLHWIYDPARIAQVTEAQGKVAFVPPRASHYADTMAYFAHGLRENGMSSQYGECLRLALQVIAENGMFDQRAYQAAYAAHFGMGGTYVGYIDRPTRAAVTQIEAEKLDPSGSDDDQLPALATLPAIVAAVTDPQARRAAVDAAVSVTHVNYEATAYAHLTEALLSKVIGGAVVKNAMEEVAASAQGDMQTLLSDALNTTETDSVAYGETTQRACHLSQGVPLAFHIMAHATDYTDAVERNILAGGDSCGRAILIGSVMGAAAGVVELPFPWTVQLADHDGLFAQARQVVAATQSAA